jgi:IclR family transcriptional regulator, acetate operon repressor
MSSARGVEGAGGVQSVGRAFEILEVIAGKGGELSLSEIAASVGLPAPSVHRLLRTLVSLGYLRQETSRRYALAARLIRLGDAAAKQFGSWGYPVLHGLMEAIGESANMAILDGTNAIYVAQVAGRHSMRMFTEVGRRVPLHATGVGKALLAQLPDDEILRILDLAGMRSITPHTVTDPNVLLQELRASRIRGYLTDDGEQEVGVSCVSVPVPNAPAPAAISISAPTPRMTPDVIREAATALRTAAATMTERFDRERVATG